MPELANREKHERKLELAITSIFNRWRREFEKAGETFPVSVDGGERTKIGNALSDAFVEASSALADQLEMPADESTDMAADSYIANFAGELSDLIVENTNRWIQRIESAEREKAETEEKSFKGVMKAVFAKIKDVVLSAKRAVTIAITEVTRMATAGERMVVNTWNRLFSKQQTEQAKPDAGDVPKVVPVPIVASVLVARWKTEEDDLVCPLCGPVHGLLEPDWPAYAKSGSPLHQRCRCWVEWERKTIGAIV